MTATTINLYDELSAILPTNGGWSLISGNPTGITTTNLSNATGAEATIDINTAKDVYVFEYQYTNDNGIVCLATVTINVELCCEMGTPTFSINCSFDCGLGMGWYGIVYETNLATLFDDTNADNVNIYVNGIGLSAQTTSWLSTLLSNPILSNTIFSGDTIACITANSITIKIEDADNSLCFYETIVSGNCTP